ncbi:septum site-determining protein MinC [Myxacorys almedinensis]|uniref:Probable septum site-determining protein MinC n=1 Tax=Myxacorys almedinensis A TaxID=2690445 RepID=A0A8J8CK62_9CYAN|nr:septum site-determining protein MinC [Myxacorys almedinensis]NDJ18291.1 septum site-determining protein MinC [Myxacorys almedinensis A]
MTSDTSSISTPSDPPEASSTSSEPPMDLSLPSSSPSEPTSDARPNLIDIPENLQVRLKPEGDKLLLILPPDAEQTKSPIGFSWNEVWQQFKQQLSARERFWQPNSAVYLMVGDRLLDNRQLQAIADELSDLQLQLRWVYTSRRQTAVVAATAGYSVEQQTAAAPIAKPTTAAPSMEEPLYVQMTLRSGTEIRHNGTVVVLGDLNPGSSVIAAGDILVWGRLRGVAHAGCKGDSRCLILALQLEPTQIRIADFVARAPETPPAHYHPEVAYVSPKRTIRIARASDFQRPEWENQA